MTADEMDEHEPALREALRALAAAEASSAAPPRVERALLRAWDARHGRAGASVAGDETIVSGTARVRRARQIWGPAVAAGLLWAALVAVSDWVGTQDRPGVERRAPRAGLAAEARPLDGGWRDAAVPEDPVLPSARPIDHAREAGLPAPRPSARWTAVVLADESVTAEGVPLVVRMRVSREALEALGVPAPGAAGMVDVDMVVGEDGVAQAFTLER